MPQKTYPIFLASSCELHPEREKFGNFINSENKRLQAKNVFLRMEVWEDMDDSFNATCKQEDYNEYLAKCKICVVLFWNKVGKYTLQEYEQARKLSLENKLRLYVYEKKAKPDPEPKPSEKESKESFLSLLQEDGKEQFQGQFQSYSELENRFKKTLDGLFDSGILTYGERAKMLSPNGPIEPNPFLGRQKELEILEERFEKNPQTLLIHAEGGMGKTTLASKYWYDSEYRYSHQAWLFCEQGITDALKTMVPKLGLNPSTFNALDQADQIATLKTTISHLEGDFLLVLDNANDEGHIKEFLQQFRGFKWNVLITSRCREVMDSKENEFLLEHLSPEEAKVLFLEYYKENSENFDQLLDRFLEGLNYHTLLIEVFAKNLKEASELGMDLKGFLGELEAKGLILDEDNNFEIKSSWTGNVDKKANFTNDILKILYDFSKLTEEERLFLVNLSLIPSENYTLEFLLELFEPENKRTFRDALKNLYRKGWIGGTQGDKPQYRLSPVIQSLVQARNKETLWEDGHTLFLRLKELLKFEQEKDNTHTKFKWVPFGKYFAELFKENDQEDFTIFLNDLALILRAHGGLSNLSEAKKHLEKVLNSDISNFGENVPATAIRHSNLAIVLQNLGGELNLLEAKHHLEKALASAIYNFDENSPATAKCRSNLATVIRALGGKSNLLVAKNHLEKALASDISNFGDNSPETVTRRNNLALVLIDLGGEKNLLEAKNNLEKAMSSDISNIGKDAPETATRRNNLAIVFQKLGGERNLAKAKFHLEKALSSDISNFGENSSAVAIRRSNLAMVLQDLGTKKNLLEAKKHLEKVLSLNIGHFGELHTTTILTICNLAATLAKLGGRENILQAVKLLDKALKGCRINFGDDYFLVSRIVGWKELAEKKLKDIEDS